MRISSPLFLILPLIVAGCSDGREDARKAQGPSAAIPCALDGAEGFDAQCRVQRRTGERTLLLIRRPDGGFRRLFLSNDGSGLRSADGAETVSLLGVVGQWVEIAVGGDRFRLPALAPKDASAQ